MIKKELLIYYRTNYKTSVLLILTLVVLMVLISVFFSFKNSLNYESKYMRNLYEESAIYQIIDNYMDGSDYQNFISNPAALEILSTYYNNLKKGVTFDYCTISNQPILISEIEKGLDQFIEGYDRGRSAERITIDGDNYKEIKALQINKQVIDTFKLELSSGIETSFSIQDLDSNIPIILGSNYSKFYQLGDSIRINYLYNDFQCTVVGFLKPSSKIYYRNEPEFYLDDYIIMPVFELNYLPKSLSEKDFQIRNYFNMINGYLITKNKPSIIESMMVEVENIAYSSGFTNGYSFIGLNPYFQKYSNIKVMLDKYSFLITQLIITFSLLVIALFSLIGYLQYRVQVVKYRILLIEGMSIYHIFILRVLEILGIVACSFITNQIVMNIILKFNNSLPYLAIFLLSFFIILSYSLVEILLIASNYNFTLQEKE